MNPHRSMIRIFSGIALALALCLAPACSKAAEFTSERLALLMDDFLQRTQTPGMVVAVLMPGMERPLVVARGMENVENTVPMRPEAVLCYGSVTKVFTALRIREAMAAGKLTPTTDIRPFFPELNLPVPVTVQHLLTHTSGLPEPLAQPEVQANLARTWTPEELLTVINNKAPLFAPGTRQNYSNTSFMLLGILLERIGFSAQKWVEAQRVAMPSLVILDDTSIVPHMASGYTHTQDNILQRPMLFSASLALGAGNLAGNAADMTVLTRLAKQWNAIPVKLDPLRLPDGSEAALPVTLGNFSYDWCLLDTLTLFRLSNGVSLLGKGGMFPGFASQYLYDPKTDTTLALLLNQEQACAEAFVFGVRLLELL